MSTELLLTVGGLSLLDTLSPATIGVTVYLLLTARKRAGSRLMVYLMAVAGFYFILGVALKLGFGAAFRWFDGFFQHQAVSWLLFTTGGILFVWSFFVPKRKPRDYSQVRTHSLTAMAALGITTGLIEAGTAFPYFAAIGLMTNVGLGVHQWLPLMIAYNVVMVLPPVLLYALNSILGRVMEGPLHYIQKQFSKSSSSAVSWIMCIVGLLLMLNSADYL